MNFKIVVSQKLHCGSPAFLRLFNSTSVYIITTLASLTEHTRHPGWSLWQQILNQSSPILILCIKPLEKSFFFFFLILNTFPKLQEHNFWVVVLVSCKCNLANKCLGTHNFLTSKGNMMQTFKYRFCFHPGHHFVKRKKKITFQD